MMLKKMAVSWTNYFIIILLIQNVCSVQRKGRQPAGANNAPAASKQSMISNHSTDIRTEQHCFTFSIKQTQKEIMDPKAICKQISREDILSSISESQGFKKNYFEKLREITNTALTKKSLGDSNVRISTNVKKVLFLGDSIVREIEETYRRILRDSISINDVKLVDQPIWEDSRRRLETGTPYQLPRKNPNKFHWNIAGLEQNIVEGKFDIAFVGGLGFHYLLRCAKTSPSCKRVGGAMNIQSNTDDPNNIHRSMIKAKLKEMLALSHKLKCHIIFVGTLPVDPYIVNMSPLKADWNDFFDFSLTSIWDSIEADEFNKIKQANNNGGGEFLSYFRPSMLSSICPGLNILDLY